MGIVTLFAITDLPLEEAEIVFIVALIAATTLAVAYVRKLHAELHRHKRQLEEQAKFNDKLNETVDRMLKIDESDGIDSNRRKHD
jgi:predicted Holliday junction resolvase-like endonuclease